MLYRLTASSFIAVLPVVMLQAQSEPPVRAPSTVGTTTQRPAKNQGGAEGDAILANWLLSGSHSEIAMARIAQERSQNNEVKLFAKEMVDEHGQFARKLQQFAGAPAKDAKEGHGADASGNRSGKGDSQNADKRQPADAEGQRPLGSGGSFDHLALIRELGEKCTESHAKMLGDKSGAEFDLAFMRMQVAAHTEAVIRSEVFAKHASSNLRPTLEQGHKTLQAHLEQAKALCLQLDKVDKTKIGSSGR